MPHIIMFMDWLRPLPGSACAHAGMAPAIVGTIASTIVLIIVEWLVHTGGDIGNVILGRVDVYIKNDFRGVATQKDGFYRSSAFLLLQSLLQSCFDFTLDRVRVHHIVLLHPTFMTTSTFMTTTFMTTSNI